MEPALDDIGDDDSEAQRLVRERQEEAAVLQFYSQHRHPQLIDTTQMPLVSVTLTSGDITEYVADVNQERADYSAAHPQHPPLGDLDSVERAARVHKHAPRIQAALVDLQHRILADIVLYGSPMPTYVTSYPRSV